MGSVYNISNLLKKCNMDNNGNLIDEGVYKLALEGADFGLWDWNIKSGEVYYNKICAEMFGLELENMAANISDWEEFVHPDDWHSICFALDQHFAGKTDQYSCEYRIKINRTNWKWISSTGRIIERNDKGEALRLIGINKDIDRRKSAELEVDKHRAFFEQLFESSPAGIALLDNEERIIRINKSFQKMFEYRQPAVEGRYINELIVPEDKKEEGKKLTAKASAGKTIVFETIRKSSSNKKLNVIVFGYPVSIKDETLGIFAVYQDITARKNEEEEIRYLSFHDQLTSLYNRRYFENEMERLDKSRQLPIGIIVADLDYLKYVNDEFGHKKGDKYIKDAAEAIKAVVREEDIVARIGGDEYAVLLPGVDEEVMVDIILRIEKKYKKIGKNSNQLYHISIGYELKRIDSEKLEDVFSIADRRMYINKENYKATHLGHLRKK